MRLYYDQGECVALRAYQSDMDEIQEVVTRLTTVTDGCEVCVTVILSCHVTVMLLNSCKSTNTTIVCHIIEMINKYTKFVIWYICFSFLSLVYLYLPKTHLLSFSCHSFHLNLISCSNAKPSGFLFSYYAFPFVFGFIYRCFQHR